MREGKYVHRGMTLEQSRIGSGLGLDFVRWKGGVRNFGIGQGRSGQVS